MIEFQNRQVKLQDGTPVIICRISGSIDGSTCFQFEKNLLGFLDEGFRYLIIVFSQVDYINSTGMGILVKLADKFKEVGGAFSLVDVPEKLIALFNMLGLLTLIKLGKTEEDALEKFQKQGVTVTNKKTVKPIRDKIFDDNNTLKNRSNKSPLNKAIRNAMRASTKPQTKSEEKKSKPNSKPKTEPQPSGSNQKHKNKKIYVMTCRRCKRKISLGTKIKQGTYKCPRCMAMFQILATGKIKDVQS